MVKIARILLVIVVVGLLAVAPCLLSQSPLQAQAEKNPYLVRTFLDEEGREIAEIIVPGRPPKIKAPVAAVPEPDIAMGINVLLQVPAFDWSYGCSATSAAMLFGYYDNDGYHTNMYAGPTNAGVCPIDNTSWGQTWWVDEWWSECPLSATHQGKDGLAIKGHVDDYWIDYGDAGPDPWIGYWTEHTHADCTGDFMGTNQSSFGNTDGSTTFYYYTSGAPLYDYTGCEPSQRDGCHGLKLFVESRGYSVATNGNFCQLIKGQGTNLNLGFTFADFTAEIDAGRPVLIQVEGHTMLGYGYDTTGSIVYIHDTWDHSDHTTTWGGTYSGLEHYGVTVLRLQSVSEAVWESYKGDYGDSGGTVDDYYEEFASEHEVYMYGTGYTSGTYKVIYWDGDGDKRVGEVVSPTDGKLRTLKTFNPGEGTAGDWHATVYTQTADPSSYSPTDPDIIANDTSYGSHAFYVDESAIPEFPTILAAIVSLGLCFGIYLWMRRKRVPVRA